MVNAYNPKTNQNRLVIVQTSALKLAIGSSQGNELALFFKYLLGLPTYWDSNLSHSSKNAGIKSLHLDIKNNNCIFPGLAEEERRLLFLSKTFIFLTSSQTEVLSQLCHQQFFH